MKPNILLYHALTMHPEETRRCCTDEPRLVSRPSVIRRWSAKLRVAVPSSLRVFGGTVRQPIRTRVRAGTLVRTPAGRPVGRVREVVVALPSGRASYAVHDARTDDARVLLIPQEHLREDGEHALVDEHVLAGLARSA